MHNNINIDFQVYDSRDPKVFIVLDTSEWAHLENKPAILEIVVPGDIKPATQYFSKNAVNVLNTKTLYLNCNECGKKNENHDLPDGIYDITLKASPDKFNKNRKYLRTTKTQLELDKLFIGLSLECFSSDSELKLKINKLNQIQLLLKASEANLRYGNDCVAQDLFFKAQELIKKSNKCKDCI